MDSSRKKGKERSVFDVHATKKHEQKTHDPIKNLIYGRNVVNLRPNFRFRHPWILALIIFVVAAVSFLGIKNLLTRGEVKDFYATTCLGSWDNPTAAQGIPETTVATSSLFSADNSAVYSVSGTQIYCGGFLPSDFSTSGTLTSVTLSLVWQVGDTPYVAAPSSTTIITSSTDDSVSSTDDDTSSTTNLASSTDVDSSTDLTSSTSTFPWVTPSSTLDASTTDTDTSSTSTDSSTDSSSPTSFLPFRSFFASIINRAFAQDDSDASDTGDTTDNSSDDDSSDTTTVSPQPSQQSSSTISTVVPTSTPVVVASDTTASDTTSDNSDTTDSSSTPIILGPPLIANLSTDSSTASTTSSDTVPDDDGANVIIIPSSTVPAIPPPAPDGNFLEVSYSTDGQLWIQLAEVNIENWPNLTVALPITSWADLQNLQIKVQGIPTTQDPVPPVYLDGMVVEAHYDAAPDQLNATTTYSQFVTDQPSYTLGQPINIVGAPADSFIEIYSLSDPNDSSTASHVFGTQVNNLGQTILDSNSIGVGNYVLVNTFETGACNQYSLSDCAARDDYVSQVPITITTGNNATSTASDTPPD